MKKLKLGRKIISVDSTPYIIAEIGVNYENNMDRAKKLIELAKEGGADGAKFQTYKAEKLACKKSPYYWNLKKTSVKSQYKLFKKFDKFGVKEYEELKKFCDKTDIDFLSTPFDLDAVNYLNDLVPFFKIASADLTNFPLIEKICSKGKPIVLSTGASEMREIKKTYKFIYNQNKKTKLILLHCIMSYPTSYKDAHLEFIKNLINEFPNNYIGYSDHTFPDENMITLSLSYFLGARVIEKHFTDKKGTKGNDHFHSMNVKDLTKFKENIELINSLYQNINSRPLLKSEKKSRKNARRSIVTFGKIKKNDGFDKKNLIMKRPGIGISPTKIKYVFGKRAKRNLNDDTILSWKDIK